MEAMSQMLLASAIATPSSPSRRAIASGSRGRARKRSREASSNYIPTVIATTAPRLISP
jgi:hypothetical protein